MCKIRKVNKNHNCSKKRRMHRRFLQQKGDGRCHLLFVSYNRRCCVSFPPCPHQRRRMARRIASARVTAHFLQYASRASATLESIRTVMRISFRLSVGRPLFPAKTCTPLFSFYQSTRFFFGNQVRHTTGEWVFFTFLLEYRPVCQRLASFFCRIRPFGRPLPAWKSYGIITSRRRPKPAHQAFGRL